MPTRKQRRRDLKSKRHQYEFVYLDAEGNELDEPPPELLEAEQGKRERSNGAKPAGATASAKKQPQRGGRREPQPPSWNRAGKRGLLLGAVVFAMFALTAGGNYLRVVPLAVVYTLLFIPFTYFIDRFAYKRYQARLATGGGSAATSQRPAKKKR
ncbi:MAG TPA: hypothetical protein VGK79_17640 [Gaiellaceae bacterium]|jgi:hypothetical protein